MVSGKTADFVFKNTASAGEVAEYVYNNWPEGRTFATNDLCISYLCLGAAFAHAFVNSSNPFIFVVFPTLLLI